MNSNFEVLRLLLYPNAPKLLAPLKLEGCTALQIYQLRLQLDSWLSLSIATSESCSTANHSHHYIQKPSKFPLQSMHLSPLPFVARQLSKHHYNADEM